MHSPRLNPNLKILGVTSNILSWAFQLLAKKNSTCTRGPFPIFLGLDIVSLVMEEKFQTSVIKREILMPFLLNFSYVALPEFLFAQNKQCELLKLMKYHWSIVYRIRGRKKRNIFYQCVLYIDIQCRFIASVPSLYVGRVHLILSSIKHFIVRIKRKKK